MKEFYWRAKQAAKAGNLADAAANLKAAAILTDMATDGRVPVEPSFLKHAVTSLQEIEAQLYRGGPLMLSNVKFIDCTFTFARGDNAAVLANYVALGSYSLTLS